MVKRIPGKSRDNPQLIYPKIEKISRKKLPIFVLLGPKITFFTPPVPIIPRIGQIYPLKIDGNQAKGPEAVLFKRKTEANLPRY